MNKNTLRFLYNKVLIAGFLTVLPFLSFAQKPNWQNLDLTTDSTFGISTEKAYTELLKGKKSKPVLVAVLDGGVDINHEDLKAILWTNKKEKAGKSAKDDDRNGYADDINGWNFLGSAKGSVNQETLELTRLIKRDQEKFKNADETSVLPADLPAFQAYKKRLEEYEKELAEAKANLAGISGFKAALDGVVSKIGKSNPTAADFENFKAEGPMEARIKQVMTAQLKNATFEEFYNGQIKRGYDHYKDQVDYNLNLDYDPRTELGIDNYADRNERHYGNNDVAGPDAKHGSHVSGIIAAVRTNSLGIMGVADNVLIMGVRCVPNGDERDKDVANAIRYAVDNGAKVINMSFGKSYSWDKKLVDDAVKYAVSKDVLLVHAAGNDNNNLDVESNFPTPDYEGGGTASSWITVGASGWKNDETLKASFSNYGKTKVDVFAPGVNINSTTPGSKYEKQNGTSMAAPVVSGLAALIRSYYPKLSAVQVKEIILKSVVKVDRSVTVTEGESTKSVPFAELSVTGGVVNAYNALKLAATY
jgi:subtilisin family serine protease